MDDTGADGTVDATVRRVSRRMALATGLSMRYAEQLQVGCGARLAHCWAMGPAHVSSPGTFFVVLLAFPSQIASYGLGGRYEPHYDHTEPASEGGSGVKQTFGSLGNRLATLMVYLREPLAGGATVFTRRNLTVWPHRGDLLFWWNLLPDGTGDRSTLHAGCPVLSGEKWIANKWVHINGQPHVKCSASTPSRHHIP